MHRSRAFIAYTHTHANTHRAKSDKYWTLLSCDSWVFKKSGLAKKKNPKTHCRNELLSLRNSVDFLQWLSMLSLHGFSCVLKWVAMIFIALDILIHCGWCLWVSDLFYFACHLKQFFRLFGGFFFTPLSQLESRVTHSMCLCVFVCLCVCLVLYSVILINAWIWIKHSKCECAHSKCSSRFYSSFGGRFESSNNWNCFLFFYIARPWHFTLVMLNIIHNQLS